MPKYYFLSDAHIGTDIVNDRREHEKCLVAWLDTVCRDATEIFLVGDIFDFWFEVVCQKVLVACWGNSPR